MPASKSRSKSFHVIALAIALALLCAALGWGALGTAAAQPPPWVLEKIKAGKAGGKPPFFVRLFSSRKVNRANEEVGRLYFIPRFGAMNFLSQPPPSITSAPPDTEITVTGEWGATVSGAVGTGLGNHLRSELEVGFMAYSGRVCARVDERSGCSRTDDAVINLMLHLMYDFDLTALVGRSLGWWDDVLLYGGGGLGYSFSSNPTTVRLPSATGNGDGDLVRLKVTEEKFIGSANAGVLYRRLEFGYRYMVGPANVGGHHMFVGFRF